MARTAEATPEFLYLESNASSKNPVAAYDAVTYEWIGIQGQKPGMAFKAAKPGDYLTIFGVGFGRTNPSVPAGETTTSGAGVISSIQFTVGGVNLAPSELLYVGLSPSSIGLYQANIRVPKGIASGEQPVSIQIGDLSSPPGAYLTVGQ
jgi:uncharacterized protein (TIGR03437 family)